MSLIWGNSLTILKTEKWEIEIFGGFVSCKLNRHTFLLLYFCNMHSQGRVRHKLHESSRRSKKKYERAIGYHLKLSSRGGGSRLPMRNARFSLDLVVPY